MNEEKKPPVILLPVEFIEDLELLNNEEIGQIIIATFNYFINDEKPKFEDRTLKVIFQKVKKIQDDNKIKYKKICERNKGNAIKRWNKSDESFENQGQTNDYTNGCDLIPVDTSGYESVPVDANIKYKNKNIKYKIENIKNKNIKNKKENLFLKEKEKGAKAPTQKKPSTFSFLDIVAYGNSLGADKEFCKRFYNYYEDTGWLTVDGKEIVNFKPLMKKWFVKEQEKQEKEKKKVKKITEEVIDDDTQRIFGNI